MAKRGVFLRFREGNSSAATTDLCRLRWLRDRHQGSRKGRFWLELHTLLFPSRSSWLLTPLNTVAPGSWPHAWLWVVNVLQPEATKSSSVFEQVEFVACCNDPPQGELQVSQQEVLERTYYRIWTLAGDLGEILGKWSFALCWKQSWSENNVMIGILINPICKEGRLKGKLKL